MSDRDGHAKAVASDRGCAWVKPGRRMDVEVGLLRHGHVLKDFIKTFAVITANKTDCDALVGGMAYPGPSRTSRSNSRILCGLSVLLSHRLVADSGRHTPGLHWQPRYRWKLFVRQIIQGLLACPPSIGSFLQGSCK